MKKILHLKNLFIKETQLIVNHIKKYKKNIHLHEPYFDKFDKKYLLKCIEFSYVSTNGEWIKKFENTLKKITKAKYVVTTNSGTSAIHSGLVSLNVNSNDEILIPNINFIASPNAVKYCNANIVLIDVDKDTFGPDIKKLKIFLNKNYVIKKNKCINKKNNKTLKAIIVTHVFGKTARIVELLKISKKFKFYLLEDATESLGSKYKKKHLGTFGEIGFLSFNGNKIITTGGGGAILTNNFHIYKKVKHLISTAKIKDKIELIYDEIGFNYRMPNINAALGYAQIQKLNKFITQKRNNHKEYKKLFEKLKCFKLLNEIEGSYSNYWLETGIIKNQYVSFRNIMFKIFHKNRIFIRPVWKCISNQKQFSKALRCLLGIQ